MKPRTRYCGRRAQNFRVAIVLLVLALVGCMPDTDSPEPGTAHPASPAETAGTIAEAEFEFAGCAQLVIDRGCLMSNESTLRVWLADLPQGHWEVRMGSRVIELEREATSAEGGLQLTLKPSALPSTLHLRAGGLDAFELPLLRMPELAWYAEIRRVFAAGTPEQALPIIDAELARPAPATGSDPLERTLLLGQRARLLLRQGEWKAMRDALEQAMALARQSGLSSAESEDLSTLGFQLLAREDDMEGVGRLLADAGAAPKGDAASGIRIENLRGALEHASGNLLAAEQAYRRALRSAERVNDEGYKAAVRVGLTQVLSELGDFGAASKTLLSLSDSTLQKLSNCDRGRTHNTRAWIALLANESGSVQEDPSRELAMARETLASHCSHSKADLSNVALNLTLHALQQGDLAAAHSALAEAKDIEPDPPASQRAWRLEIEARLALLDARPAQALELYRQLSARAEAMATAEFRWGAALGEAEALQHLQRPQEAIEAFERADRALSTFLHGLGASDARALVLARFERLPRRYIAALLAQGRDAEALAVARRYRNEPLRMVHQVNRLAALDPAQQSQYRRLLSDYRSRKQALEAQALNDWTLPVAELQQAQQARRHLHEQLRDLTQQIAVFGQGVDPGLGPAGTRADELSLLYFPLEDGWAAFAFDREHVRALPLPTPDLMADANALSAALLEPFRTELEHAQRIRVMGYGPLRELDFHRLQWNGQALGLQKSVIYASDLGELAADARPDSLLLVADPGGDLPAARREALDLDQLYSAGSPDVRIEALIGPAASTDAVLAALNRATFFHYAGHTKGPRQLAHGPGFALADGSELGLGDVLSLQQVPRHAVLAACSGSAATIEAAPETLSLAHALLSRGSESVVAAPRPVDDRLAAALSTQLHRRRLDGASLESAFVDSQRQLQREQPQSDWSAFRLYARF
jgi:tetratricopeptide (TPR) repeat protein